jgi:hypothetical protein
LFAASTARAYKAAQGDCPRPGEKKAYKGYLVIHTWGEEWIIEKNNRGLGYAKGWDDAKRKIDELAGEG